MCQRRNHCTEPESHAYTNPYSVPDANANTDSDAHRNADSNSYAHSDADPGHYANSNPHTYSGRDGRLCFCRWRRVDAQSWRIDHNLQDQC